MSKKNRRKRRKYKYNIDQFMLEVCGLCRLCKPNTDPSFCYTGVYIDNPKRFINKILPELMNVRNCFTISGQHDVSECPDDELQYTLELAFCDSNYCGNGDYGGSNCQHMLGCLHAFRQQIYQTGKRVVALGPQKNRKQNRKQGKKNKGKYITPTPAFFCNNGFRKEIDRMIYGNNTEQQDKGEKPA